MTLRQLLYKLLLLLYRMVKCSDHSKYIIPLEKNYTQIQALHMIQTIFLLCSYKGKKNVFTFIICLYIPLK